MGFDPTRTNPVYQQPQKPADYGKPNTNQAYDVTGIGGNTGGTPKATPIPTAGGFSAPAQQPKAGAAPPPAAPVAPPASPYGYASGPGILENWFNQRANGTDPAYEYAMKRGGDAIDNRMAAGGSYNSGARGQQLSDYAANMGAQREGQLDTLAAGASGEHQGRLNSMFSQGQGLAAGESGINSAYDLSAGKSMSDALAAALGFTLNKAGVDQKSQQQGLTNMISLGSLFA
jgi:hypothetical protein